MDWIGLNETNCIVWLVFLQKVVFNCVKTMREECSGQIKKREFNVVTSVVHFVIFCSILEN